MAITAGIRAFAAACGLAAVFVSAASADVKGFNAAMRKGDVQTAAAEAASTWTTWDKADPDTALLAREFGFVSLLAGKNAEAEMFGKFLVEEGATLKTPDGQPKTSAVLHNVARFRQKSDAGSREALRAALVARAGLSGIDMTSVIGWEVLYTSGWATGQFDAAVDDAMQAAAFMKRDEKGLLSRRRAAELSAASARFIRDRNKATNIRYDSYNALADVHDAISADINGAETASVRDQLWPLKWRANAWIYAADAYIYSSYEQIDSLIKTKIEPRRLVQPQIAQVPGDESGLPLCDGKFEGRDIRYPASKSFKGLVGSVIVRAETDSEGRVTKTTVLGAVPADVFADSVVSAISTWRLKPAKGVDTSTCRLSTRNYVYAGTFIVG